MAAYRRVDGLKSPAVHRDQLYAQRSETSMVELYRRQHVRSAAVASCSYRDTGVQCSVVGPFLCPVRPPETRYQTIFRIRHILLTVFVPI